MTNSGQPGDKKQWDFSTHEGRLQLYYEWARERVAQGRLSVTKEYTREERCAFLADWLRWLITRRSLNPRQRLPPYEKLAAMRRRSQRHRGIGVGREKVGSATTLREARWSSKKCKHTRIT